MFLFYLRYLKENKIVILEYFIVFICGIERENMKIIFNKMYCVKMYCIYLRK